MQFRVLWADLQDLLDVMVGRVNVVVGRHVHDFRVVVESCVLTVGQNNNGRYEEIASNQIEYTEQHADVRRILKLSRRVAYARKTCPEARPLVEMVLESWSGHYVSCHHLGYYTRRFAIFRP